MIAVFLLFGLCGAFTLTDGTLHQAVAQTKEKRQLKNLEKEIRARDEKRVELEKQAEQIATQRRKLQLNMIFIAEQIRANEQRQIKINKKLDALLTTQSDLLAALNKDRVNLSQSLAALQRFEKSTPPALAVRPDDALEGIRGALAMGLGRARLEAAGQRLRGLGLHQA